MMSFVGVQVSVAPSAGTAAQHAEARDGAHLEQSIATGALLFSL